MGMSQLHWWGRFHASSPCLMFVNDTAQLPLAICFVVCIVWFVFIFFVLCARTNRFAADFQFCGGLLSRSPTLVLLVKQQLLAAA